MSNIYVSQDVSFLVDDVLKRDVYKAYDFRLALIGNILPNVDITLKDKFSYVFEHFSHFTRLCCNPIVYNRKIENMAVIGKDKNTHEFIETIIPLELIGNFRLREVHKPRLLEMIADSDWYYFESDSESFVAIANILLHMNPVYITHNGDRKYSLDTGENEDLKKNIKINVKRLSSFLCDESKCKDPYSIEIIKQLENEINLFKWSHMNNSGYLDMCGSVLGDFVIHNFGGKWAVVNEKLCVMITNRICIFPMDIIRLYYYGNVTAGLQNTIAEIRRILK